MSKAGQHGDHAHRPLDTGDAMTDEQPEIADEIMDEARAAAEMMVETSMHIAGASLSPETTGLIDATIECGIAGTLRVLARRDMLRLL